LEIQHSHLEDRPRRGTTYRCHICRLELVLDPQADRLEVQPLRVDEPNQRNRETA
jgi:hypothetical protein